MTLLEVKDLSVAYGEIEALRGVSLTIDEGAVVALLGSNGAGKSTTLRAISGLVVPRAGSILFDGESIEIHRVFFRLLLCHAEPPDCARRIGTFCRTIFRLPR